MEDRGIIKTWWHCSDSSVPKSISPKPVDHHITWISSSRNNDPFTNVQAPLMPCALKYPPYHHIYWYTNLQRSWFPKGLRILTHQASHLSPFGMSSSSEKESKLLYLVYVQVSLSTVFTDTDFWKCSPARVLWLQNLWFFQFGSCLPYLLEESIWTPWSCGINNISPIFLKAPSWWAVTLACLALSDLFAVPIIFSRYRNIQTA